jgi:hypothetical protein
MTGFQNGESPELWYFGLTPWSLVDAHECSKSSCTIHLQGKGLVLTVHTAFYSIMLNALQIEAECFSETVVPT